MRVLSTVLPCEHDSFQPNSAPSSMSSKKGGRAHARGGWGRMLLLYSAIRAAAGAEEETRSGHERLPLFFFLDREENK